MIYEYPDELYHYGRLNMKWYQHIFTSGANAVKGTGKAIKTGAGKVSKAVGNHKAAKKAKKEAEEAAKKAKKPKSFKDMSIEELRKGTTRYNAEADYMDAKKRVDKHIPKSFKEQFMNEALKPALISSGKKAIENSLDATLDELVVKQIRKKLKEQR